MKAGSSLELLLATVLTSFITRAEGVVDERQILLDFYHATNGHAWGTNFGWSSQAGDVCEWYGVICSAERLGRRGRRHVSENGKVLGLNLPGNFMTGRAPPSLLTLPTLIAVDFSNNPHLEVDFAGLQKQSSSPLRSLKLRGSATTSIVGLAGASNTLEEVDLSESRLDSQLPSELFSLTQLSSLRLAECSLLGTIPDSIQRLSLLRELNLYENALSGSLPSGMARLVHMRHLTLSFNRLHGTLPDYLSNYVLLREFWAHNNDFTGRIPSFHQAPDIHKIYLNDNSLSGDFPVNFIQATSGGMGESKSINVNVASNKLTGGVPDSLDALANLNIVWMLGDNEWTSLPEELCNNVNWNQGSVKEFGCFGLLCPPRTYSRHGFQTTDTECQFCGTAEYYGATKCFDKDDRSVLVELYAELKGENWDRSDNWLKDDDFCTWYGIECWDIGDSKTGRVRRILLPNNGLVGTVPETMYSMHHLTTIDFSRNDIVLPFHNVGKALHLFSVNIAFTRTTEFDGIEDATDFFHELYADSVPISGNIPTEILAMSSLKILSMQECGLSGTLPAQLFDLLSLSELYLTNNDIGGDIPDRWDELKDLEVLALARNQFKGPIPASLDYAPHLLGVSLQDQTTKGGGLTGPILPMATTTTLRTLLLGNNKLEGNLPEDLLTAVEGEFPITVDLSYNLITGKVHGTYDRFERMTLYLEGNFITEIDDLLCSQEYWMQGNVGEYGCEAILCPAGSAGERRQFTDSVCRPCNGMKGGVSYAGQRACGTDSTSDLSERDLLELLYDRCGGGRWHARDLWMSEKHVCDWYGIGCDGNGSITSIQLGGNQLVGSFPTEVFLLPNLMHLKLYSNTINFNFDGIENAKSLKTLALDNTGLTSLKGIGRARSLEQINAASNKLSGLIPEELSRLVNLQVLDISRNDFNGYLPYWLRSLVSLTTFSASHNRLSGPVYDFAAMNDLVYLDISHNSLTGNVPASLLKGASLEQKLVADISSNEITGRVPAALSRLPLLSLQLEDNQIEEIDPELCLVEGWNNFAVKAYGCNAILCPIGTWNQFGRQSTDDSPCSECRRARYMGATHCHRSEAARVGVWVALVILPISVHSVGLLT